MTKKKRKQKTTVYVSLEGKRERCFFDFLYEIYAPKTNAVNINVSPRYGGTSDTIVLQALKMKNNYDKVYAWFDEDIKLSNEIKESLSNAWRRAKFDDAVKDKNLQSAYNKESRNPILIVSNPCGIDGFLIQLCRGTLPKTLNTANCKKTFASIFHLFGTESDFYKSKFDKETIESQADNLPILKLILSIFKDK